MVSTEKNTINYTIYGLLRSKRNKWTSQEIPYIYWHMKQTVFFYEHSTAYFTVSTAPCWHFFYRLTFRITLYRALQSWQKCSRLRWALYTWLCNTYCESKLTSWMHIHNYPVNTDSDSTCCPVFRHSYSYQHQKDQTLLRQLRILGILYKKNAQFQVHVLA